MLGPSIKYTCACTDSAPLTPARRPPRAMAVSVGLWGRWTSCRPGSGGGHRADAAGPWKKYGELPWLKVLSLGRGLLPGTGGEGAGVRQGPRTNLHMDIWKLPQ